MILISHRGNINGPDPELENNPDQILHALSRGYDVEVDVWLDDNKGLMLGHDAPRYFIDYTFLMDSRLWCHAKNHAALEWMISQSKYIHSFWHQNDRYTLTSRGFIWSFPRVLEAKNCIAVYPELYPDDFDFSQCEGICSDHIADYKKYK
jgi:hypothetical protein